MPLHSFALAGLAIAPVFMPDQDWMAYDRTDILAGEWWRLWTGHFSHFTSMHALMNGVLLLLLSLTLHEIYTRGFVLALAFIGPVAISILLALLVPEMIIYRGASALASLFMALLICHAFYHMRGKSVLILYVLIFAWLLKLVLESQGVSVTDLPYPIHVAWQAHLAGILIGVSVFFVTRRYTPNKNYLEHNKIRCRIFL